MPDRRTLEEVVGIAREIASGVTARNCEEVDRLRTRASSRWWERGNIRRRWDSRRGWCWRRSPQSAQHHPHHRARAHPAQRRSRRDPQEARARHLQRHAQAAHDRAAPRPDARAAGRRDPGDAPRRPGRPRAGGRQDRRRDPGGAPKIDHRSPPRAKLPGADRPRSFEQVVSNLLENAVTHGDEARPVEVVLSSRPEELRMTVHNHGTPIDPAFLPLLFNPFARSAKLQGSSAGTGPGSLNLRTHRRCASQGAHGPVLAGRGDVLRSGPAGEAVTSGCVLIVDAGADLDLGPRAAPRGVRVLPKPIDVNALCGWMRRHCHCT